MNRASPDRGALKGIARVFLVVTAVAPTGAVYALTLWSNGVAAMVPWLAGVLVLVAGCLFIMRRARAEIEREQVVITKSTSVDKDVFAFLVAYALPLITPSGSSPNGPALCGLALIAFVVLYQLQLVYVNPLLGMFGYHFVEVEAQKGRTALLITRNPWGPIDPENPQPAVVARLSAHLWLNIEVKTS